DDVAAFGQNDGSVKILSLRGGSVRAMDRRASAAVGSLAFSPDGRVLATSSDDGTIDVWDVGGGSLRETFDGPAAAARGLVFSGDGATVYSGSNDGSVVSWDVRGGRRLGRPFRFAPVAAAGEGAHRDPPNGAATAVAVSPDGASFATSPAANQVTLWRAVDETVRAELRGPCGSPESVAWSQDGLLLACVGDGPKAVVWNVAARKVVRLLGPTGPMGGAGINFSPDDTLVGTAGIDGELRVFSVRTGRNVGQT